MDESKSAAPTLAVNSPEYTAALIAQLDYDSTNEGQRYLAEALASATDPRDRLGLRSRLVSGAAARRFRLEQAALMPRHHPRSRKDPRFPAHAALAQAREDLARQLGLAAAESDHWGRPTLPTQRELLRLSAAVRDADLACQANEYEPTIHPAVVAETDAAASPWSSAEHRVPVGSADVGVLVMLGVAATWDAELGKVVAQGDTDAAARWGYDLVRSAAGTVMVSAPNIVTVLARRAAQG